MPNYHVIAEETKFFIRRTSKTFILRKHNFIIVTIFSSILDAKLLEFFLLRDHQKTWFCHWLPNRILKSKRQ